MIAHVSKKKLADALGSIERIVPSRSSNPSLSLVKLELRDNLLTLSGSNLDIDIQASLEVDTEDTGTWALPAQVFSQVVRALPGELVELSFAAELELQAGAYATKLQLVEASLPSLRFPESYSGSFSGERLATALTHVRYAAAVAEYQAIFRGVRLEFDDRHVRAVATDGFRLAYYHMDDVAGLDGEVVLPARSVDELAKVLASGEVKLELLEGQLSLASGPYKLNLKLMEGAFPDYQRVIPSEFPVSVVASAKDLLEGVQRVAVMADRTANNRVDLFIRGGTVQVTAEGAYGRAQEALTVAQEGSESEIALAYNADYLLSALRPVEGDVRFSFSGPTSPSVMSSLQDPSYLAMVVPLRTG